MMDPAGVGGPVQLSTEPLESTNVPFKQLYKYRSFKGDAKKKMKDILKIQFVSGSKIITDSLWHYKVVFIFYFKKIGIPWLSNEKFQETGLFGGTLTIVLC